MMPCKNIDDVLKVIDEEYALWKSKKMEADSIQADIWSRRLEYQLATIRRIRKKILGIPVDPNKEEP